MRQLDDAGSRDAMKNTLQKRLVGLHRNRTSGEVTVQDGNRPEALDLLDGTISAPRRSRIFQVKQRLRELAGVVQYVNFSIGHVGPSSGVWGVEVGARHDVIVECVTRGCFADSSSRRSIPRRVRNSGRGGPYHTPLTFKHFSCHPLRVLVSTTPLQSQRPTAPIS